MRIKAGGLFRWQVSGGVYSLLAGLILWQVASILTHASYLPSPTSVFGRVIEMFRTGGLLGVVGGSALDLAIGAVISIPLGLFIGTAMAASWRVNAALGGPVDAFLTAPALVFAPIYFAVFTFSRWAVILVVIHYSIFFVIVGARDAIRRRPEPLLDMAQSFGCSKRMVLLRVRLPYALPMLLASVRLGIGRTIKGLISGEMFIAAVGLGAVIEKANAVFDARTVLAVLTVVVAFAFVVEAGIRRLDRHLTRWLPDARLAQ